MTKTVEWDFEEAVEMSFKEAEEQAEKEAEKRSLKQIKELIMKHEQERDNKVENICHLNKDVHDVLFRRFVSEIDEAAGVICRVPRREARKIAVDFIQNNTYGKMCLTATINLVMNGAFSKEYQLDDFIHHLLWVHAIKACINNGYEVSGSKYIPTTMI